MFQTLLLSILAFAGFAPAKPHAARVGPGPDGRRHAILPTATASAPSTGPGPGGRRHALHRKPTRPVVQPEPPVALRNRPSDRELRERAYALGLRTTETVRSIPAGLAVRYYQAQAGCAPSQDGLGRVTRWEAETALGRDLVEYVSLCLDKSVALPSVSPARESEDDATYRVRLHRAMLADVELWESAAIARDAQRALAQEAGIPQPPALRIPHEVEVVIAQKAAAAAAALKRRTETAGGSAGKAGSNVVRLPTAETPKAEAAPSVPAGPK